MSCLMILDGFIHQPDQITDRQAQLHLILLDVREIQQIIDQSLLDSQGVLTATQHAQHIFQHPLLLFFQLLCLAQQAGQQTLGDLDIALQGWLECLPEKPTEADTARVYRLKQAIHGIRKEADELVRQYQSSVKGYKGGVDRSDL